MGVLTACVHFQFPEHGATQRITRQHALHRTLYDPLRGLVDQFIEGDRFQATGVARMVVIYFVVVV